MVRNIAVPSTTQRALKFLGPSTLLSKAHTQIAPFTPLVLISIFLPFWWPISVDSQIHDHWYPLLRLLVHIPLPSPNVGCPSPTKPPKPVHSLPSQCLTRRKSRPFTNHVRHFREYHSWDLHCEPLNSYDELLVYLSINIALSQNNARTFVGGVLSHTFESPSGELHPVLTLRLHIDRLCSLWYQAHHLRKWAFGLFRVPFKPCVLPSSFETFQ